MGYGIYHEMTFALENGVYELVNDSFDERFMTGVCSNDYATAVEVIESEPSLVGEIISVDTVTAETSDDDTPYDVNAAIRYANQYCGTASKDYSNDNGETDTEYGNGYNTEFTIHTGADCANFVSQCLYAVG
jgi:hypothetical protein